MNHNQLILSLYKIGAIKFGQFTLKSGLPSSIYLDLRQIVSYPKILREVADAMWEKVKNTPCDLICGVPYTALPIATIMSIQTDIPMIMRRKEKKAYGTKRQVEGNYKPGQTCLIVEDIMTTGSSILETAEDLTDAQLNISDVVVFINRNQGGDAALAAHQFRVHAVITLQDVLHQLFDSGILTESERDIVNQLMLEQAP